MAKPLGTYTERIRLLKRVKAVADTTGQEVESWPATDLDRSFWAQVKMLSGIERIAAGAVASNFAVEVRIPGRVFGIEAVDRFRHMDAVYTITGVYFDGDDVVCSCALPVVA